MVELQPFRQLHAVHADHLHIQKRHIRIVFLRKIQGILRMPEPVDLGFGRCLPDGIHQIFQRIALIIHCYDDHSATFSLGIVTVTVVPLPGLLSIPIVAFIWPVSRRRTFARPTWIFPSSI